MHEDFLPCLTMTCSFRAGESGGIKKIWAADLRFLQTSLFEGDLTHWLAVV